MGRKVNTAPKPHKSRASPPTIEQLLKMEQTHAVKRDAYYAFDTRLSSYRERVMQLGTGYSEVVNGVRYVTSVDTSLGQRNTRLNIIKCK